MDHLKEGIGLRGYGQRDPLVEYKKEGFEMFQNMIERIKEETVDHLFKIELVSDQEVYERSKEKLKDISMNRGEGEEENLSEEVISSLKNSFPLRFSNF